MIIDCSEVPGADVSAKVVCSGCFMGGGFWMVVFIGMVSGLNIQNVFGRFLNLTARSKINKINVIVVCAIVLK